MTGEPAGGKMEGLQEPNNILLQRWHREAEHHRVKAYLLSGFLCTCGVEYDGNESEHVIEACVAKALPAASPDALRVRLLQLKEQAELTMKHSHGDQLTQQAAIIWTCEQILASSSEAGVQVTALMMSEIFAKTVNNTDPEHEHIYDHRLAAELLNAALSRQSQPDWCDEIQQKPHHPEDCLHPEGHCILDNASQPIRRPAPPLSKSVEKGREEHD